MVTETDIALADGRMLHSYDTGSVGIGELTVVWHHGTPNIGAPPSPLLPAAAERGIRFVSYLSSNRSTRLGTPITMPIRCS